MGYYIRVLSPSLRIPSLAKLQEALVRSNWPAKLTLEAGPEEAWERLLLSHADDIEITDIERSTTDASDVAANELDEFLIEAEEGEPRSAAAWLVDYLPTVKTIYAFQLLSGVDVEGGWEILGQVKEAIREQVGGIIQADGEGFSNEEGFHILWQFGDDAAGPWWMAVLKDGQWIPFQIELSNPQHREAFCRGEVPLGVIMMS